MTTYNSLTDVVTALNNTQGKIHDDHKENGPLREVTGVGVINKGDDKIPVSFCDSVYFSLNEVYLDEEGNPHISTGSVGGVIKLFNDTSLATGILNYNEEQSKIPFSPLFLSDIYILENGVLVSTDLVTPAHLEGLRQAAIETRQA